MNKNIQQFIDSIESDNTVKVVRHVLKDVDNNIEDFNLIQLEQFILDQKPNSPKAIITACYVIGLYAKWLEKQGIIKDDSMYRAIQSIDKKLLWKKAKPNAGKKFISNEQYKQIVHDIGVYEDFNGLYYQTLFKSIYEGIYNDDLSVLKNLRASDVGDDMVTLHCDSGQSYKLKISEQLASELKKLADIDYWERKNSHSVFRINTKGVYKDSVFKTEQRNTGSNGAYQHSYYSRLRKISKEYVEYNLLPYQLYISGIMYRIKMELNKKGITLSEAFSDNNHNPVVKSIISNELIRCNSNTSNLRELVKGHLDSF